jgi:hypothetical protein
LFFARRLIRFGFPEASVSMSLATRALRVKASDEPAHVVRKDVRKTPAAPQAIRIGQRPGVVRVPTFQVQLTRPTTGRLE